MNWISFIPGVIWNCMCHFEIKAEIVVVSFLNGNIRKWQYSPQYSLQKIRLNIFKKKKKVNGTW